ncbi:DUF4920 domain-containing protein [bacterium]|nr:DUF4920 domain-containing protein [bacterium]
MMRMNMVIGLVFCVSVALTAQESKSYGKGVQLKASVTLDEAIAKAGSEKEVLVQGKIHDVCAKKGCWLVLQDGEKEIRVTFEGYSFFVPTDSKNKTVRAQGKIMLKEISESEARHYAEDAGKSKDEIEKIKGSQKAYSMIATGVEILD